MNSTMLLIVFNGRAKNLKSLLEIIVSACCKQINASPVIPVGLPFVIGGVPVRGIMPDCFISKQGNITVLQFFDESPIFLIIY